MKVKTILMTSMLYFLHWNII